MNPIAALAVFLVGVIAACGSGADVSPSPSAPENLAGTAWRAIAVSGATPVAGREPTLAFKETEVNGNTGCNGFFGGYAYGDGEIEFTNVGMTMMFCEGEVGTVETAFTRALNGATTASIDDGGQLLLSGPGGDILFKPDAAAAP